MKTAHQTMELFYVIVISSTLVTYGAQAAKHSLKPASDYFQICHRSDPDISSCIKNSINDLRPRLIEGIPELGIVPLDPLNIPRLEFKDGSGNFNFEEVLTNVTIHGLGAYKILSVKMDISNLTLDIDMETPFLMFNADYEMRGKVLLLPLDGKGDCVMNFTDVTTLMHSRLEVVTRDGEEFLQVKELKWTIGARGCQFYFNNLFNGNKALGETTNKFLNDNWREAFETYKHLPEEAFGILFKDFSNRVYRLFSLKALFPV